MEKTERFALVLSPADKAILRHLARRERLSAAAVVRRLIWQEAQRRGLRFPDQSHAAQRGVQGEEVGR
jgi:hypothetical protein